MFPLTSKVTNEIHKDTQAVLPRGRKAKWSPLDSVIEFDETAGRSRGLTTYFSTTRDKVEVTNVDLKSKRVEVVGTMGTGTLKAWKAFVVCQLKHVGKTRPTGTEHFLRAC
jgi:hypothetical protein